MRLNDRMKADGELAVRRLSEKARLFYDQTDPLSVYEYERDDKLMYAFDGCFGPVRDISFEELNEYFESFYDEVERLSDEA